MTLVALRPEWTGMAHAALALGGIPRPTDGLPTLTATSPSKL